MEWFKRAKKGIEKTTRPREIPDDKWVKCPDCNEIAFRDAIEKSFWVCKKCGCHLKVSSDFYVHVLLDKNSFCEINQTMSTVDILEFKDKISYAKRIVASREKSGKTEAITTGSGRMNGYLVAIGVMDFSYMGGSMGSVVGEKISRLIRHSMELKCPLNIVSASGGARMQEGAVSLIQMAKTAAMLGLLAQEGIPYISICTNPTTGGVTASYSMLGDIIIAEPKALVGFAGPRVIRETIRQELPPNFQRSEFLLEHGFVDLIADRRELKQTITTILDHLWGRNRTEHLQKAKSDLYVDAGGELKNIPRE
jgi:acetyl-CoA carboxylase carboxyl transferase subunit beta